MEEKKISQNILNNYNITTLDNNSENMLISIDPIHVAQYANLTTFFLIKIQLNNRKNRKNLITYDNPNKNVMKNYSF